MDYRKSNLNVSRLLLTIPAFAASLALAAQPAFAAIDNSATASGTYAGTAFNSNTATASVPVTAASPSLTVAKTVSASATISAGANASIVDANDTITYQYVVTNTGNVTINDAAPTDAGPKFGAAQSAGTGVLGAFSPVNATLAPGASQTFTAVYTLSQLDVDRAAGITDPGTAVNNTASATGTPATGTLAAVTGSSASTTIPAGLVLQIAKSYTLADVTAAGNGAGTADVGELITYTYTVTNTGNVAITDVSITDTHEGVALPAGTVKGETLSSEGPLKVADNVDSTDATADNGTWSLLQPGSVVTFTYVHTVTQAEVNGG